MSRPLQSYLASTEEITAPESTALCPFLPLPCTHWWSNENVGVFESLKFYIFELCIYIKQFLLLQLCYLGKQPSLAATDSKGAEKSK